MAKIFKFAAPPIAWACVIFLFSSYPTGTATEIIWTDFIIKKTAHVVEYGILTLLTYRALTAYEIKAKNAAIIAILISVLYGLSDEYHQSFTPGRTPKIRDVGFDTIGATISIYGLWNILPKAPMRLRSLAKKLDLPYKVEK